MIMMAVGLGVIVTVMLVGLVVLGERKTDAEQRLEDLATGAPRRSAKGRARDKSILRPSKSELAANGGWLDRIMTRDGMSQLYEQADVGLPFSVFWSICAGLGLAGAVVAFVLHMAAPAIPVIGGLLALLPFAWLVSRRNKRIKTFTAQMPDALELVGRALRAGHGMASGLHVVAEEMPAPISQEFARVYEEQNLGIPLDEALRGLSLRIPTMDVRFFVTAVIIQRSTGGDLAEILDKIGRLIRERFLILGQVKALTGEGRISGAILLAMPPALMAVVYATNPAYISLLWTTEIGKKMLIVTAALQLVGAVAIKKIVNIKV
jgi:tight adherence protein B